MKIPILQIPEQFDDESERELPPIENWL